MSGSTFPIALSSTGYIPQTPAALQTALIASIVATNPGYTADLPGTLIEDMLNTSVAALLVCDSSVADLVNSITPYGANEFMLTQLGNVYGVSQQSASYTSVYVVFTGPAGYPIPVGFIVSDGTYQYSTQDNVVIGTGGTTPATYCLATVSGSWAVPASTVTQLVTSVPSSVGTVTVTNPTAGVPGQTTPETEQAYRSRVLQAGLSAAQGMPNELRTALEAVSGVQTRLVSIQQQSPGWKVLVGGGDPYAVAGAIFDSLFDISTLVGAATMGTTETVSLNNYPDTYSVKFVVPAVQTTTVQLTWNTISTNYVSPASVSALGIPTLVSYINSVTVGQPLNIFEMQNAFQTAVASLIPTPFLTRMVFTVSINGTSTPPTTGTGEIPGDSESYFYTAASGSGITISQG